MSDDRPGEAETPRDVARKLHVVAGHILTRLLEPGQIHGRAGLREDIRHARELLCEIERIERAP